MADRGCAKGVTANSSPSMTGTASTEVPRDTLSTICTTFVNPTQIFTDVGKIWIYRTTTRGQFYPF